MTPMRPKPRSQPYWDNSRVSCHCSIRVHLKGTPNLDIGEFGLHGIDMRDDLNQLGPFSNHPDLDLLAYRFFRQFSRMEYALKATGRLANFNGDAKANWDSFGDQIDPKLNELAQENDVLQRAIRFMMDHPPKKQTVQDGSLEWQDVQPTGMTDARMLLVYVRRVRNNLFHGGKFNSGWLDPQRSKRLLEHALTILERCIDLDADVGAAYRH